MLATNASLHFAIAVRQLVTNGSETIALPYTNTYCALCGVAAVRCFGPSHEWIVFIKSYSTGSRWFDVWEFSEVHLFGASSKRLWCQAVEVHWFDGFYGDLNYVLGMILSHRYIMSDVFLGYIQRFCSLPRVQWDALKLVSWCLVGKQKSSPCTFISLTTVGWRKMN